MSRRVVITRPGGPYEGATRFAERVSQIGFAPFELPVLVCVPLPVEGTLREQLEQTVTTNSGGWLAFLSPTAIWAWKSLAEQDALLGAVMSRSRIAVQGTGTANALREVVGRSPDFMPTVFVAEEFAKEFAQVLKPGQRVWVPQSAEGRDLLAPTLAAQGFKAASFSLYRLENHQPAEQVLKEFHSLNDSETLVVFMSPSAVRASIKVVGTSLASKRLVSIGPITSRAIRDAGLKVWREATEHSEEGVLKVLSSARQAS